MRCYLESLCNDGGGRSPPRQRLGHVQHGGGGGGAHAVDCVAPVHRHRLLQVGLQGEHVPCNKELLPVTPHTTQDMFRPPDLISSPSLYQRSAGEGMPTTLHSRLTVPCSVSPATNSSRNTGAL